MTKEEFLQLSPEGQMAFIEYGGTFSPSPVIEVCCDSSLTKGEVVEKQVELLHTNSRLGDISEKESGLFIPSDSSQPAPLSIETTHEIVPPFGAPSDGENPSRVNPLTSNSTPPIIPPNSPPSTEQWADGFDIKDPVELLFLLDDDIKTGRVQLHKWQAQFMFDFASGSHTKDLPFRAAVRACNGSGKDKYIVSACVVWLCMRYGLARGVVTNGSGVQLDNQTEAYIRYLCERANAIFAGGKELIWKCNYRYYECLPTKSPIVLFATDEPNKAEGYHPLKAGGKMAIFASEAKAIPDTIFTALTRCTGFTHRVDVSTPGTPIGYFYDTCSAAVGRESLTTTIGQGCVIQYHITAFDCPHITPNEIKQIADSLPGGVNNPVYKSAVLAEFSTTDAMVVIPHTFVWWAYKEAPKKVVWLKEPFNKAGLDLSDGGAETVLVTRNGNKHLKTNPFKFDDTQDTIKHLEELFEENELIDKDALIFGDCCGIGKPILDQLVRRGWRNIRYIDSRSASSKPKVYLNRGTELFFHIRELMEKHELIIEEEDKVLFKQLAGRYYKISNKNVHQLLTKLEQRSKGYPSPDRADAFNLAFCDYKSTIKYSDFKEFAPSKPVEQIEESKPVSQFSLKTWAGSNGSSLEAFRRNVSKRQPTTYLQHELERYLANR